MEIICHNLKVIKVPEKKESFKNHSFFAVKFLKAFHCISPYPIKTSNFTPSLLSFPNFILSTMKGSGKSHVEKIAFFFDSTEKLIQEYKKHRGIERVLVYMLNVFNMKSRFGRGKCKQWLRKIQLSIVCQPTN